jgi:hypothetical protein
MRKNDVALALLLCAAGATSCAYRQKVKLAERAPPEEVLARVVVEDRRPAEEKETRLDTTDGHCARTYGDGFIEPTKVEYLRRLLAERLAPASPVVLRLDRFETIEGCNRSQQRAKRAGMAGALGGSSGP